MKDKEEHSEATEKNGDHIYRNEDDDYNFTEDQRKAALELQSLYRELGLDDYDDGFDGSFSMYEENEEDVQKKLKEINAQFDSDETPLESERFRKVRFKESLVDLVVPISPRVIHDQSVTSYYGFDDLVSSSEDEDDVAANVPKPVTVLFEDQDSVPNNNCKISQIAEENHIQTLCNMEEAENNLIEISTDIKEKTLNEKFPADKDISTSPTVISVTENIVREEVCAKKDEVPLVQKTLSPFQQPTNTKSENRKCSKSSSRCTSVAEKGLKKVHNDRVVEIRETVMPSYKGNTRSPYGIPEEVKKELKRFRQIEVQQKRLKELSNTELKQKKREEAEKAYKAWLEIKRSQTRRSHSASPPRKQSSSCQKKSSAARKEEESEEALRLWLEHKAYQENKERIMRHLVQQEKTMLFQRSKREDSRRAYSAWLKKKTRERQQIASVDSSVDLLKSTFQAYFGNTI